MGQLVLRRETSFLLLALAAVAGALALAARLPALEHPDALALGIAVDLTLGLPLAFYLLVLRPRGGPALAAAPVAVVGLVLAALVLPAEHRGAVRTLELLVVPLELALVATVIVRVRRAWRAAPADPGVDVLERFGRTAREVLPSRRLAEIVTSELAVLGYALGSWRARPHVAPGTRAISVHRRSSHGPIVLALVLVTLVEVVAVHVLLARWSAAAAWVATALSAYGALWLVADWRAAVLRPVLVGADEIRVRAGLRWSVAVPRARVIGVRRAEPADVEPRLSTALLVPATHWLVLDDSVEVAGPYGMRRSARALGLPLDEDLDLD